MSLTFTLVNEKFITEFEKVTIFHFPDAIHIQLKKNNIG